jgi:cytochrome c oxidase subunit 2
MPLLVVTTALTGIAFLATQVLLFLFLFRYQSSKSENASYIKGELKLEFTWTIIPAITFLFLFFWGQRLWHEIINIPDDAVEIEIIAQQFVWKTRYPGQDGKFGRSGFQFTTKLNDIGLDRSDPMSQDDFVPIQMHVPKNKPVKIHLRSNDVIHSFYVPAFKIKMDAVPGMTTTTYFTANHTTNEMRERLKNSNFDYEIGCAELCGRMHFAMKMILVVDEPDDFEKWYRSQKSIVLSEKM